MPAERSTLHGGGVRSSTMRVLYANPDAAVAADFARQFGRKDHWDIRAVLTAAEALALAQAETFNVLVTARHLPDMEGETLASKLKEQFQKLNCFILWDDTEETEAIGAGSGKYHLIPRHFSSTMVMAFVQRAVSLNSWLRHNTTLSLVSGIQSLPSFPANYMAVLRQINMPSASTGDIGEAIAQDMAMTSKLLQVANSAFYGYSKKVTSPTHAVCLLGLETVKSLIHYTHVLNNFPRIQSAYLSFDQLLKHSMGVANIAKKITFLETGDDRASEEAFTAGLLHDIGKFALMAVQTERYKTVLREAMERDVVPWLLERVKLETTHAECGAYLLGLWGIPLPILEAVAWHHYPSECKEKQFNTLTAVHVANVLDYENRIGERKSGLPELDMNYLGRLGLKDRVEVWRKLAAPPAAAPSPGADRSKQDAAKASAAALKPAFAFPKFHFRPAYAAVGAAILSSWLLIWWLARK